MSETTTSGGFRAEPTAALDVSGSGGCCGNPPAASTPTLPESAAPAASPCCGTAADAQAAGSCCGAAAKAEAVASGVGCCG